METLPGAELRLLPEAGQPDRYVKDQLIYHSIVGSAEGAYGYFLNHTTLESTFIVKLNGDTIQCMWASDRADANSRSNRRAISVETEDNRNPDSFPWTDDQLDELVRIGVWAVQNHAIPPVRCPGPYQPGIGYHSMHGAPSPWTPARGKTCPGLVRREQFDRIVLPRIIETVTGTPQGDERMNIRDVMKFAQAEGSPVVWLLNMEDGTREGMETHDARLGLADLFNLDPTVTKVHADVINQFKART